LQAILLTLPNILFVQGKAYALQNAYVGRWSAYPDIFPSSPRRWDLNWLFP